VANRKMVVIFKTLKTASLDFEGRNDTSLKLPEMTETGVEEMSINNSIGRQRLHVKQGSSLNKDARTAVREIVEQIHQKESKLSLVYFSDDYDLHELARSLAESVPGPIVGCTTAGQLSANGFQRGGITGVTLASDCLEAVPYLISPLSSVAEQVQTIANDVHARMEKTSWKAFGLLLVDGLSKREEVLAAALYRALGDVPIVGGSAGDMLKFKKTLVYHQGKMYQDAAVFTLILTTLPFSTFKHQHFHPTKNRLVITEADPPRRIVSEINGESAVNAYAKAISLPVEELNATVFSRYPLMLKLRDDYFIRSIAGIGQGGSLKFYCAIDKGLVLAVGQGGEQREALKLDLASVRTEIGEPAIILVCDCILRRLEMEEHGIAEDVGKLLAANRIFGFSTYGEQFNSVHVNQTFTGVAIAGCENEA
jgi:hypothetical protein